MSEKSLVAGFLSSVERFPNNHALELGQNQYTYQELYVLACQLANNLSSSVDNQSYVGILSSRTLTSFQGVLATLFTGLAYLPFDLKAKPERNLEIINSTECRVFIVDDAALLLIEQIETQLVPSTFLFPNRSNNSLVNFSEKHKVIYSEEILSQSIEFMHSDISENSLAYVLFTSGSTGKPKGVPISHKNICAYIQALCSLYPLCEQDRCTQAFDFTFDPSVHDMFVTWFSGACLCVMDDKARLGAQYFIKNNNITVWNTLPSIVKLCLQMRSFNERYLQNLKYVFFNGEPLYESVVSALQERVGETKLINLYGLTETTVNLAHFCWEKNESAKLCRNGIVPIGKVFPGIQIHLLALLESEGSVGNSKNLELTLAGSQIFSGYLPLSDSDRLKNEGLFFYHHHKSGHEEEMAEEAQCFMRTGDLVAIDDSGFLHIVGRNDEQVKISGHRVDLNLVRYHLEQVTGCIDALVLKQEDQLGNVCLVGFLKGSAFDVEGIQAVLTDKLPPHMHLSKISIVEDYPYLVSGKIDKRELLARHNLSD